LFDRLNLLLPINRLHAAIDDEIWLVTYMDGDLM
jgi:hypothetical protein